MRGTTSKVTVLTDPASWVRRLLFATMCAALAALCMIFGWVSYQARRDVGRDVATAAGNLASAVAHDVDRNFETMDLSLQAAVRAWNDPDVQALGPALKQLALFDGSLAAPDTGTMVILDESGIVRANSLEANPKLDDLGDRDYFRVHLGNDLGLFVSKPFVSRLSGKWIVALSRRISKADGSFGGVVVGTLELSYLDKLYDGLTLGEGGTITLFRTDGTVVTRKPYAEADINRSFRATDGFTRIRVLRAGSFEGESPVDGHDRLISFHRVGNLPLIQVVEVSADQAYAAWWRKTIIVGGVLGLLGLSSLSLLLLLYGELARRIAVEATLARLAGTDGLTEVANRRCFDECLEAEWRRATRDRTQVALLMIDADHFKAFNDAFGHVKGDDLLKGIARAIASSVHRPGDLVARYGGEEFAVLLPATDLKGAMAVAEVVRDAVVGLAEPHPAAAMGVATVSIGVACHRAGLSSSSEQLIRSADAALYAAKTAGRNCCRAAAPGPFLAVVGPVSHAG